MEKELVEQCLFNWLGYGNINSSIWFIGTEEGGAEIWRQKTKELKESLKIRTTFKLSMDFIDVWENHYSIPIIKFKGPNVWRFIAAFLLYADREKFNGEREILTKHINEYIFEEKKFGRKDADHFSCELLPLPKKKKNNIDPYRDIWKNIKLYHKEVIPKRFDLIKKAVEESKNLKIIVSYERDLTILIKENFSNELKHSWEFNKEKYYVYIIKVGERNVNLIATPFFGQGRISYKGIEDSVKKLVSYGML